MVVAISLARKFGKLQEHARCFSKGHLKHEKYKKWDAVFPATLRSTKKFRVIPALQRATLWA